MKIKLLLLPFCLLTIFFFACSGASRIRRQTHTIYTPSDKVLYDTIAHQDSLLFAAFNNRNIERLKQFFSTSIEVYQDNIGVRNYEKIIEAFKGLFEKDYVLTRTLVKGSLEVYPIKDYGAIETGRHTFCHKENGKPDCGTFKFVHIWEKQNNKWKITRIVTYDHKL